MLTITKLKMWRDPGYTRQCVEVPPVGSKKLPTPDYESSETLRPRRGALLNAVELPLSYLAVHDMSYLYMEIEDGQETPNTMSVFGWILSVEETASANEAVIIRWTPDYWRTYSDNAVFGKGTITRCANDTYKRPFITQPRKWLVKNSVSVSPANHPSFLLIKTVTSGDDVTSFEYYYEELELDDGVNRTPTVDDLVSGRVDEVLGFLPDSIIGCWIVPINMEAFFDSKVLYSHNNVICWKSERIKDNVVTRTISLTDGAYGSDDMRQCALVGPYGDVQSMLPWGFDLNASVYMTVDISVNGPTFYVFNGEGNYNFEDITNGAYLSFTGLDVPINTNAWSDYSQTYQRSYDKRMAEIQRNQRAVSGVSSTGTSMVGGAIAGATKGGGAGAIGGAIAGGTLSIIGSITDFLSAPYFNDEIQKETDKLVSNQVSTLLRAGGGIGWITLSGENYGWKIVQLEADATSLAEYTGKITNDGYDVEIPVGTPTAFLTAGGPLQIQNLVLTGSIPPEAKTYIKTILSNGVRIVENNPSGVVP